MSDLTPFYLHARDAKQTALDAQAGDEAFAQYGPQQSEPMQMKPVDTTDVTTADVSGNANVQVKPRLGAPAEPTLTLENAPAAEQQPHRTEGAAAAGEAAQRPPFSDTLDLLTHYLANTDNPEQYRQQLLQLYRKDPREAEAGIQQILTAAGLSMPIVNSLMALTRDYFTQVGAPDWATTAAEYVAAAMVPSKAALGVAKGGLGLGQALLRGAERAPGGLERRVLSRGANAAEQLTNTRAFLEESVLTPARVGEELGVNASAAVQRGLARVESDGFRLTPEGVQAVQGARSAGVGERTVVPEAKVAPSAAQASQKVVEDAGLTYRGVTEGLDGESLHWFDDPKTGSTLALPETQVTPDLVAAHLAENRRAWGLTPGGQRIADAAPGESVVLNGSPASENHLKGLGDQLRSMIDETGVSTTGLALKLGQAGAGALIGAEMGDTTEDRLRNAMIGAGVATVTPTVVRKVSKWLVENAPSVRNLVRKPTTQYPPEVGQSLEKLFTGYEADLNAFTRGTRPHSLAWDQANQMIRDGRVSLESVKQSFPGKTMNDSEAMAFIKTVADYGQQVQTFATELQGSVRAGKPLAPDQIDGLLSRLYTMREFLPKPRGVVAEAGRTLSAMNEPTSGLNQYLAQWHSLFTDPVRGLAPERLVDAIAGMEGVEQHAAVARLQQQPGWADMAIEGLYGALLGGPVTQIVNGLSNTIALAYAPIERLGSAVMGDIVKWNEPFALLYGYTKAAPMAFANAKKAFLTGERTIGGFSKVETGTGTGPLSGVTSQYLESSLLGKIAETGVPLATAAAMYTAGIDPAIAVASGIAMHPRYWPLGPRAMVASDELFKTMLFEGEKWAQGVRRAAAVDPKLAKQVLFETVQNPSSTIKAASTNFANEFTYNSPPGPVLQGLIDGMNSPDLPGPYKVLAKTVLPFTNIPSNLLKFVGRRTPGLQQLHAQWWSDITTPGPRQDTAMGQLAMGGAMLAGVASFAAEGGMVGSGPADPNLLREWLADGNQEYSVKFGDKTFSINRMDPWGQMASIVADWSAISAHIDDASNDQIAAALLMVVSKDMMSKTYLEGASTFLDAITNKDPNKAYHWLYQYTGTPVPALIRQFRGTQDPYLREVRDLVDSAMNKVPEFSKNLAPRKNLFAEPIMSHEPIGYGIDYVNPFPMKTIKHDPATQAVLDNKISTAMPAWSIYGDGAKNWTLDPQRESVGVPLTHGLRNELIDLMGKPLKAEWTKFINSDAYDPKNLGPDSANALVFKQLHQAFARGAVAQLVDKHPELLKGLEDALTRRAMARSAPLAPRPAAAGPSILDRLQGVGAPAGVTPQ